MTHDSQPQDKTVLFFGDPMCSWCWGFAPIVRSIEQRIQNKAGFQVITTGLRPNTLEPWNEELRGYIHNHWQAVQKASGQAFDFSRFEDSAFIYNTEPACRAVVTVRDLAPSTALDMFEALQKAFYAEGQDITKAETLADIAQDCGLSRTEFLHLYNQTSQIERTANDFQRTRFYNVTGYPSVLLEQGDQVRVLSSGYQSFETLAPQLDEWLNV